MSGFSFGGTAPAANNNLFGGSSSGVPVAVPVPVPVAGTTHNNNSSGGFSFGGSSNPGNVSVGNVGQSGTSTGTGTGSGQSVTHNTSAAAAVPSSSSSSTSILTIPCFNSAFPNLGIHAHIESILEAIYDPSISSTDLTLQGQQLIHLLNCNTATANANANDNATTAAGTNDNTYGHTLAKPTTPNNNHHTAPQPSPPAMIQLPHNPKPTQLPPSLSSTLSSISSKLEISLEHSAALYGACILDTLDVDSLGMFTVDYFQKRHVLPKSKFIRGFVGGVIEKHAGAGCYVNLGLGQGDGDGGGQGDGDGDGDGDGRGNINMAMNMEEGGEEMERMAMDLYFWEKGYTLHTIELLIQHRISASNASTITSTSNTNSAHTSAQSEQEELLDLSKIILKATNQLLEAGLVQNLLLLVRELTNKNEVLRRKICNALEQQEWNRKNGGNGGNAQGSFGNTSGNSTFGTMGGTNAFGATAAGTGTNANAANTNTNTNTNACSVSDADYAMYEFTFQQRQLACRCLFYLAYHTQLTTEEVVGLIDLIQDLTNGGGGSGSGSGSMGSGLPILDPLRDVPDPYRVVWNQNKENNTPSNSSGGMGMGMGTGMGMGGNANAPGGGMQMQNASSMTPQQIKAEKKHEEWKEELLRSLWSVRGLTKATVTTTHADFSGQLYHSMTLDSSSGGNGNGGAGALPVAVAVTGGKPQLMKAVSSLIMAVLCALDGKNVLIDRSLDSQGGLASGNALLPLDNISIIEESVKPMSDRLDPNGAGFAKWKRQDIAGLLSAAFALLLRPAADVMVSSGSPAPGGGGLAALKATFRSCLESPTIAKSMTFARVSLMPCLGSASMKSSSPTLDNDFAFYMSILSDFTAQYLEAICSFGDLPISSQRWMDEEKEELRIRHVQETQKKQLEEWSGKAYHEAKLPTEVDITKRPDCLDDIIALAICISSTCPECSSRFWLMTSTDDEGDGNFIHNLKPSMVMKKLEKAQAKDPSLLPIYASFLSALSLTNDPNEYPIGNDGASVICEWLSDSTRLKSSPTAYDVTKQVNWIYILYSIQWYTEQLNPPAAEKGQTGWGVNDQYQKSTSSYDVDSTAYYYGADDNSTSYSSNAQTRGTDSSSSRLSTGNKKKELDDRSVMILSSFLSLLSQVALKSEESRLKILDIRLDASGGQRTLAREDDAITILFQLLVTSISPEIRGLALTTIANLVRQPPNSDLSKEGKEKAEDTMLKCWELLESSQILPIAKLGQYSPLQNTGMPSFTRSKTPAEISNWFSPNEQNGIVYEMEYVEAKKGSYPSTEGLLKLLTVLFSSDIYPSNLGDSWRPQQGCTPYMEYVTDFVLPRVLRSKDEVGLYFSSPADKSRLVTRALEVVDAVLTRYVPSRSSIPRNASPPTLMLESHAYAHSNALVLAKKPDYNDQDRLDEGCDLASSGPLSLVASFICPDRVNPVQSKEVKLDFASEFVQTSRESSDVNNRPPQQNIPRAKSPGYVVLADMLSSTGSLFDLVTQLLVEESGSNSVSNDENPVALALFGETLPSFETAKAGRDYILDEHKRDASQLSLAIIDSTFRQLFLQNLLPDNAEDFNENSLSNNDLIMSTRDDTLFWKECCALLSLKILCASAARNTVFADCNSSNDSLTYVPVMRFQSRDVGFNNPLLIKNVQLTQLSRRLLERSYDPGMNSTGEFFLTVLSQYIGYQASSLRSCNAIGLMAMSLVKYLSTSSSSRDFSRSMCGLQPGSQAETASSVSSRLAVVPLLKDNENECLLCDEILSLILHNLKESGIGKQNLAHVMLGLSDQTLEEQRQYLLKSMQGIDMDICQYSNVLDTILELLSNVDFVLDPNTSTLATKCFEIIHHLCEWSEDSNMVVTKLCIMNKLRKRNFWQIQLLRFLGSPPDSDCLLRMILSQSPVNGQNFQNEEDLAKIERDSNILHCISWLLKGVAFELHSLMGGVNGIDNLGLIGKFPTSSPQPQQCRQLLELLLSDGTQVLLNTLQNLPLTKPGYLTQILLLNKPSDKAIAFASCEMNGSKDVVDGFTIVDPNRLCKALCGANERLGSEDLQEQRLSAHIWARAWNSYVQFSCASSHIAKAWSFLSSAVFSSCRPLLLTDYDYNNSSAYDGRSTLSLLKCILGRFCEKRRGRNNTRAGSDLFALFALSMASIPLVETILELHQMTNDEKGISVGEEDMFYIIEMLIDTIISCASDDAYNCDGVQEETAVIFATILSAVLESNLVSSNGRLQSLSSRVNFGETAMKACLVLTKFCSRDKHCSEESKQEALSLCDAARSGLASLLKWFDHLYHEHDEVNIQSSFLFQLYASESSISSPLTQLVDQVLSCDNDISNLLETIACCNGGTDLLVQAGVTRALTSASEEYTKDFFVRSRNTYGNAMADHPQYIFGHVSLLNTMLASEYSEYTHQRLILDAAQFIQSHISTIESLFGQFPESEELLFDFLTTIALVASTSKNGDNVRMQQLFDDSILSILDQRIEGLAMHVLEFPFPDYLLPFLPGNLRVPGGHQGGSQVWWNRIPTISNTIESSGIDALVLPHPPCGIGARRSMLDTSDSRPWTVRMYRHACAATNCLDVCLTYMTHRSSFQTDMVSLAVALYRSTETICSIEERLRNLRAIDDEGIVDMMNFTNINSGPINDNANMRFARRKEIESLQNLGASLASCVAKLLQVIKSVTDITLKSLRDGSCTLSHRDLQVSSQCLLTVFTSSQIECAVGCIDNLQDDFAVSNVLQTLVNESKQALTFISR